MSTLDTPMQSQAETSLGLGTFDLEAFRGKNVLLVESQISDGIYHSHENTEILAFQDMKRLVDGKKLLCLKNPITLGSCLRHLIKYHRVSSPQGNPILRVFGIPLHELSVVEELLRDESHIKRLFPMQRYANCLVKDIEHATIAEDVVIAIRTLAYMQERGVCQPDWDRVRLRVPDYAAVRSVNLARDSREMRIDERWHDFRNSLSAREARMLEGYVARRTRSVLDG